MAKRICLSREAHERLKTLRDDGETFSEAILRVTSDGISRQVVGLDEDEQFRREG